MRYLFPNFCVVFPSLQGEMPHSSSPPPLPNGMKDLGATWYKDKVSNAGNLLCTVIVYLHRLELIKKYFVSTRKSSSMKLINSFYKISHHHHHHYSTGADNLYVHSRHSLTSLNKHMCCNIQRTAKTYQTKK